MQVAASLPVVGLPVSEQQVSEPVPRWQREHLLLQFDHCPPSQNPEKETEITANRTSTPRRWNPQNQLRSSSLGYSKRTLITNTLIQLMASSSSSLLNRKKKLTYFVFGNRQIAALLFFPPRQQVEDVHPSVRRGGSTFTVTAGEQLVVSLNTSILPA